VSTNQGFEIPLTFTPQKGFGGGFRTEWLSAKAETPAFEAGIDSGAGLGNPYLTFWIELDGEPRRYFSADVRDLLRASIDAYKAGV
jgi:hypothetical protein